jgi:hypothetical protein
MKAIAIAICRLVFEKIFLQMAKVKTSAIGS